MQALQYSSSRRETRGIQITRKLFEWMVTQHWPRCNAYSLISPEMIRARNNPERITRIAQKIPLRENTRHNREMRSHHGRAAGEPHWGGPRVCRLFPIRAGLRDQEEWGSISKCGMALEGSGPLTDLEIESRPGAWRLSHKRCGSAESVPQGLESLRLLRGLRRDGRCALSQNQ